MNESKREEILEMVERISVFGGLTLDQINKIIDNSNYITVDKDEKILVQGKSPKSIYVIINGKVEVFEEVDGEVYPMSCMSKGECFGEIEILGIMPNIASVKTIEKSEFLEIPKHSLHKFCNSDMAIFNILILNMARETCRRLAVSDKTLVEYMRK